MCQRKMKKLWLILLVFAILSLIYIWNFHIKLSDDYNNRPDWISVRLLKGQQEYKDKSGFHVVVGHYVADAGNGPNLTDEIINSNNFAPIPNEGHDGMAVIIPPHLSSKMQQLYRINSFNLMASDRIPLNRSLPDYRRKKCVGKYSDIDGLPKTSVIIVFHNEAWSTLLRTVWSVINRSPKTLLEEIILVDDFSNRKFLGKPLELYIENISTPIKILRSKERIGLIRARLLGAAEAKGQILTFLDAHCECTPGWLEPLVTRVAENRTRIVCPLIDIISDDTFAYVRAFEHHWGAFNWDLHFRWYFISNSEITRKKSKDLTDPYRTPAMAGGLFAMDKNYFFEIGAYDDKMQVWGGENLELSLRAWQCGGSVEIAPCSHVGHVFRKSSPYKFPGLGTNVLNANLARVAMVWMDEWQDFFFKFNSIASNLRDQQQVRMRLELRKKLNCKNFKWYLDNVWPEHYFPTDDRFFGKIKSILRNNECIEKPVGKGRLNQPLGPARLVQCSKKLDLNEMWVQFPNYNKGFLATNDNVCLDTADDWMKVTQPRIRIHACSGHVKQHWEYNEKKKTLKHLASDLCLDIPNDGSIDKGLVLSDCNDNISQKWNFEKIAWR